MATPPTLVLIIGPPAVGKMAVGRELERRTGMPLLHNHMTIDLVLPFFDFGTPPFSRLVELFRTRIVEEVVASDLPGLIFTYVWAFDESDDQEYVQRLRGSFTEVGGRVCIVELAAPLPVRLERNVTPLRLAEKPSKRDLSASRQRVIDIDSNYQMNSLGAFPWPEDHLLIETTELTVEETADRVMERFSLPICRETTLDEDRPNEGR